MNSGMLIALAPLLAWGSSDYLSSRASRRFGVFEVNFAFAVFSLPLPIMLCAMWGFPAITAVMVAKFFVASTFLTLGFMAMVRGFSGGVVGLVSPLVNAKAIAMLAVTALFFNEPLRVLQLPAIFLIIGAIVYATYNNDSQDRKRVLYSVRYGLLGMLMYGVGTAFSARYSLSTTWYGGQLIMSVAFMVMANLLLSAQHGRILASGFLPALLSPTIICGGLLASAGGLGFFGAIALKAPPVVATTVASAAPLVTALYAYLLDHERLSKRQQVGMLTVLASVVYLNLVR